MTDETPTPEPTTQDTEAHGGRLKFGTEDGEAHSGKAHLEPAEDVDAHGMKFPEPSDAAEDAD